MVKPYLSRLRPAETGPRLHPRPRSRFEPAPALPIDGPAIGSLGLSLPPESEAGAVGAEMELEPDTPYPYLAGSAVAATPGNQSLPPVRIAAPGPDTRDEERPPARAARADEPPRPSPSAATTAPAGASRRPALASPALASPALASPALAGNEQDAPSGLAAAPEPDTRDDEGAPTRSARADGPPLRSPSAAATASAGASRRPTLASNEEDSRQARREGAVSGDRAPAPWSATRVSAPQPERAPPERLPPGRHGHLDRASRETPAQVPTGRPDDAEPPTRRLREPAIGAPADRVQAMARWLRDADTSPVRAEAMTSSPAGPQLMPAPPGHGLGRAGSGRPGSAAAHTEVTVTIGRIEVKAPAADPAPTRPRPSGQRRAPSLDDYLESRTRARGRLG
jgi:DNA polymerase III subunit gamma/tau